MKQGTANNSHSGQKREPISHTVNPTSVGQIGLVTNERSPVIHSAHGVSAPAPAGVTIHHCGSQGKHR